jgi:hypothetical protein
VKRGARLLTVGSDLQFLANSARSGLAGIRRLLDGRVEELAASNPWI